MAPIYKSAYQVKVSCPRHKTERESENAGDDVYFAAFSIENIGGNGEKNSSKLFALFSDFAYMLVCFSNGKTVY